MEYRILPHGGEKIIATVRAAYESGVNYFDMAGGHAAIFAAYGKALKGIRDKVYLRSISARTTPPESMAGPQIWTR